MIGLDLTAGLLLAAAVLQGTADGTSPLLSVAAARCPDEAGGPRISDIQVDNRSVFEERAESGNGRLTRIYELANSLHVRTREEVIRRTLLFEEGDCFDPAVLSESERVLRGHPFLASAELNAEPQPDGSRRVVVRTRDEWSKRGSLRLRFSDGLELRGARLEEMNLFGTGRALELYYDGTARTAGYGVVYRDPQMRGSRWTLATQLGRTDAGGVFVQSLTYPFLGDGGRWAGIQGLRREAHHFEYVLATEPITYLLVPVRRRGFHLGGIYRLGTRGRQTLVGAAISYDDVRYPRGAAGFVEVNADGEGAQVDPEAPQALTIAERMEEERHTRIFLLLGQRNLSWIARRGLDSLEGLDDVPVGTEAELAVAPPFPGDDDRSDLFARLRLFAGLDGRLGTALIQFRAEGQRDTDAPAEGREWREVLVESELLGYSGSPFGDSHALFIRLAAAGGWHTRGPLQLTLGGDYGIRAYREERFPGGRRVVATIENRFPLGRPFGDLFSLGGAVFVDAGRMWAGDALFGIDSGWLAGAGVALRAAFPPATRSPLRLDVGIPFQGGSPTFRFSVGDPRGIHDAGDPRLIRSRYTDLETRLFHFPTAEERRWP